MQADVERTANELAAGTLAWERAEQQLGQMLARSVTADRAGSVLTARVQAARQRTSTLAGSLYRNPYDPTFTALLDGRITSLTDVLDLRRALNQDQHRQQQDLDLLNRQVQMNRNLVADQRAATAAVSALRTKLDGDLARLQAKAQLSVARLRAAEAEIRQRQADAARAELKQQMSGVASSLPRPQGWSAGEPSCSGQMPPVPINGFLPPSALCPLQTAPGQRLAAPAAAAFDSMSDAFRLTFGMALCVTDSYRDYATQVRVFQTKPNLAATPGRSQHGWGLAVDLCGGVQNYGTPPFLWLKQNAGAFGFQHPDWAEPDGSRPEPWHWEFRG